MKHSLSELLGARSIYGASDTIMNNGGTTKHTRRLLITSCCLVFVVASASSKARDLGGLLSATWQRHNVLLDFRNLPKRYSCNDLWYKVRDVLMRLGSSPNMDIRPRRCERALGLAARSPRVHVEFYAPRQIGRGPTRGADLEVRMHEVRIEPGEPRLIDASDCTLLRQMMPALPGKIVRYRLPCSVPSTARPPFSITVRALISETSPSFPLRSAARSEN